MSDVTKSPTSGGADDEQSAAREEKAATTTKTTTTATTTTTTTTSSGGGGGSNSTASDVDWDAINPDTGVARRWGPSMMTHDPVLLSRFKPRASDIFITTAPKSGTTFMSQILYQLKSGGDDTFALIGDVVPWIEFNCARAGWASVDERLVELERLPEPRVFKTHCTFEQTPFDAAQRARAVLTFRDVRDVCVSFWHHKRSMDPALWPGVVVPTSFDEHFDDFVERGFWYRGVRSWWPQRARDNVLLLRYEELVGDFDAVLRRIIAFTGLGRELDDAALERVRTHSSIEWMKREHQRFEDGVSSRDGTKTRMAAVGKTGIRIIREGKVGSHAREQLMSDEQAQRLVDKARAELEPECFAFIFPKLAAADTDAADE